MQLREDVIQRPDGSQGIYSDVDKPDFALIIPVERREFHLVNQYRCPVSHRSWEFTQGTLPDRQDGDPTGQHSREHEEQDMHQCWFTKASFEDMIRDGTITDDSTVAAYMLYLLSDRERFLK